MLGICFSQLKALWKEKGEEAAIGEEGEWIHLRKC